MRDVVAVFVVGVAAVLIAGIIVSVAARRGHLPDDARQVGVVGAALLIGGGLATVVVGVIAREYLGGTDRDAFDWFAQRSDPGGAWTESHSEVSRLGSVSVTTRTAVVAGVLGAVTFARRGLRWWFPPAVVVVVVLVQRISQTAVSEVVGRAGDRPAGIGNYPSGGVARILVVWGVAVCLVWAVTGRHRWVAAAGSVVVVLAAWTVGYGRLLLEAHYPIDLVGGFLLGAGILGAAVPVVRWVAVRP